MVTLPTSGLHDGINEQAYHADPASLSSSGAKTIAFAGPDVYWKKKQGPTEYRDAFDFGSVVHGLVLGEGDFQVFAFDSWRSKASREARDASRAVGAAPILIRDYEKALAMKEAVFENGRARDLLSVGRPEVSFWATDPDTGVLMKGRADWLREMIVDLKTTSGTVDQEGFLSTVLSYHYGFQFAYYQKILFLNGEDTGTPEWIAVNKSAPYVAGVFKPSERYMEQSHAHVDRALRMYAHCLETSEWPSLQDAWRLSGVGRPSLSITIPSDDFVRVA